MMLRFASNIQPLLRMRTIACRSRSEIIKSSFSIVFDDGCGLYSHNLEKTFFGEARYKYPMKANGRFEVATWAWGA